MHLRNEGTISASSKEYNTKEYSSNRKDKERRQYICGIEVKTCSLLVEYHYLSAFVYNLRCENSTLLRFLAVRRNKLTWLHCRYLSRSSFLKPVQVQREGPTLHVKGA